MARPSGASEDVEAGVLLLAVVGAGEDVLGVPFVVGGSEAEEGRGGRGLEDLAGGTDGGSDGAGAAAGAAGAVTVSDGG